MLSLIGYPPEPFTAPVSLTIGAFDGVHRGHQALISQMVADAHAADGLAGLLTFAPHPLAVLRPELSPAYLTTPTERDEVLAGLGLDFVLVLPFTRETAALPAEDFMRQLAAHVPLRALWIGPDFALGRDRAGDAAHLAQLGAVLGYQVAVAPSFEWKGAPVRSSRIRQLLTAEGDVTTAAELLGRPYSIEGIVQGGAQRGRTIGFPTANLATPPQRLLPQNGVYACWAWRGERGHPAVVNVGIRPSFDAGALSVEAFLLDFSGDLYGEALSLSFSERLRGERRFDSPAALIAQIQADVSAARALSAAPPTDAVLAADGAPGCSELRHTADVAAAVTGDDQRQLFARAATALARVQHADPARPITLARKISAAASDPEALLVAWLSNLLLAQEIEGETYTRFAVHALSATSLTGMAYGYAGYPEGSAVKAVTYYDLHVTTDAQGWHATVTFDV